MKLGEAVEAVRLCQRNVSDKKMALASVTRNHTFKTAAVADALGHLVKAEEGLAKAIDNWNALKPAGKEVPAPVPEKVETYRDADIHGRLGH